LASDLILTERDDDDPVFAQVNKKSPKAAVVKGRIITTLAKAKEVRPLVEKCITLARKSLAAQDKADGLETEAERNSEEWDTWRNGDGWQEWNAAIAPVVNARRRVLRLLGNKRAMEILFEKVVDRFADRDGGYTRVLRLAKPRLGDAGVRAILEFVGKHDRVTEAAEAPAVEDTAARKDVETQAAEGPGVGYVLEKDVQAEDQQSDSSNEPSADDSGETDEKEKTE